MTTSPRGIAWVTVILIAIVLFGHAGGILGESWCGKVLNLDPSEGPGITRLYAHHGLWLLLLPAGWFTVAMALLRRAPKPAVVAAWLAVAAGLILLLALTGLAAAIAPMSGWHPSPGGI